MVLSDHVSKFLKNISFLRILRPHMFAKVAVVFKLKEFPRLNIFEMLRFIVLKIEPFPKSTPSFPDTTNGAYM